MIAVIVAVVSSIGVWFGSIAYDKYTYPERIDKCVSTTLKDHSNLAPEKVREACKIVTK